MKRKTLATLGMVIVLLVSLFGTAAAQTGTDPSATPTAAPTTETEEPETVTFTHPVVQILSAYFGREVEDETTPTEPTATVDPNAPAVTPTPAAPEQTNQEKLAEEITAYHQDGLGFGVLVKFYAMAEAAKKACATAPTDAAPADGTTSDGTTGEAAPTETTCTPVTVDQLVTSFKSGSGMGTLFKEYGKPALLGVGHVKQQMKAHQDEQGTQIDDEQTTTQTDDNQTTTGKNKNKQQQPKNHPNKGKGSKK